MRQALTVVILACTVPFTVVAGELPLVRLLEGVWSGRAPVTPIGERPYDIEFKLTADGLLEGAADPGGAIHHWSFREENGGLTLRFLSTFAGNTEPIWLDARDPRAEVVEFQARTPDFLRVRVTPGRSRTQIQILHGGRLHVEIHLTK